MESDQRDQLTAALDHPADDDQHAATGWVTRFDPALVSAVDTKARIMAVATASELARRRTPVHRRRHRRLRDTRPRRPGVDPLRRPPRLGVRRRRGSPAAQHSARRPHHHDCRPAGLHARHRGVLPAGCLLPPHRLPAPARPTPAPTREEAGAATEATCGILGAAV
ncbi:hypothetical protein ACU686_23650 [Yinghuangia aomiensis]